MKKISKTPRVPMQAVFAITLLVSSWVVSQDSSPDDLYARRRSQEIVTLFNKQKHVVKEKYGVRLEKYKKIQSEPVIKQDIREYSGEYEVSGWGGALNLQVAGDGKIKATGFWPGREADQPPRKFTLQRARIRGAMLTATKVYEDGTTEILEGVFMNLTSFASPSDTGHSEFGLGVVGGAAAFGRVTLDRVFYQKQP